MGEKWTPQIISDDGVNLIVTFALRVKRCHICKKLCMNIDTNQTRLFWYGDGQKDQMKRAGIVKEDFSADEPTCEECSNKGLVKFTCNLCSLEQFSTEVQESFGDPAEFLCKTCYATVPAQTWDKAVDRLRDAHQWDYS